MVRLRTDCVVCLDAVVDAAGVRRREADAGFVGGPISVLDGRRGNGGSSDKGIGGNVDLFASLVTSKGGIEKSFLFGRGWLDSCACLALNEERLFVVCLFAAGAVLLSMDLRFDIEEASWCCCFADCSG